MVALPIVGGMVLTVEGLDGVDSVGALLVDPVGEDVQGFFAPLGPGEVVPVVAVQFRCGGDVDAVVPAEDAGKSPRTRGNRRVHFSCVNKYG